HDMFGPSRVFQSLADAQAARGRCVLVPNLFWRSEPDGVLPYEGSHAAAWARLERFDADAAVAELRHAVAWLRRAPEASGKVAVWGFCFSGTLAFLAAARAGVDAALSFYALGISRRLAEAARIACPTQLHYGAADEHVPASEIDAVAAGVAGNARIALHRYQGAGHSFFNPVRPTYDAVASALAAERVDALLDRLA
ncbi:MAG TPA: dienelactone hydrolase family protein, partial [Stellaceae bacterium]|nr:dienelactone hydrolase family protein [Stellaceae bacterium]